MPRHAEAPSFQGEGKIVFVDREYDDPGPGQLLVRVHANAICGTDREQFYSGSEVTPGHEAAGTVELAGPSASIAVGTRGAVYLMDYCGQCRSCKLGHTNQCLHKRADMGFTHDGGYGPYETIHESNFFPVPDDVSPVEATLLLDAMGTSSHAISRAAQMRLDVDSIYIAGAGPIGLGLLVMAKLRYGADVPVFLGDISQWRLDYAEQLGAIPVDASDDRNIVATVGSVDAAFDSTGKQTARGAALSVLGKRGVLVCVGHGEGLTLDVSGDLIAPERAVLGSEYFRYNEMPGNLALLRDNRAELAKIITHTFPVAQIGEAFDTFLSGQAGKVVVTQEVP
jgi:threonine dehydrogenase-like Zn-dependent dehydrogenase